MGILRTAVSKLINAYIIRNPVDHYLESSLFLPTPDLPQGLGGILHPDSVSVEHCSQCSEKERFWNSSFVAPKTTLCETLLAPLFYSPNYLEAVFPENPVAASKAFSKIAR